MGVAVDLGLHTHPAASGGAFVRTSFRQGCASVHVCDQNVCYSAGPLSHSHPSSRARACPLTARLPAHLPACPACRLTEAYERSEAELLARGGPAELSADNPISFRVFDKVMGCVENIDGGEPEGFKQQCDEDFLLEVSRLGVLP